jgi:hypothetical protein
VTVIVARIVATGDAGEATVRDARFEQTQPLMKVDPMLLDETVRDVPIAAPASDPTPAPVPVPPAPTLPAAVTAAPPDAVRTLEVPAPQQPPPPHDVSDEADTDPYPVPRSSRSGLVTILLLLALIAAAAGGWYYWSSSRSQGVSTTSSTR